MATAQVTKKQQQTTSGPDVHHMIRTLANAPTVGGAIGPDQADEHVRTWLENGYSLHTVTSLGTGSLEGNFTVQILYIFVR